MKVYLAAPIVGIPDDWREKIKNVKEWLISHNVEVFDPRDYGVENSWGMNQAEWGRAVFAQDSFLIKRVDFVVVCDFGRHMTAGASWECGYAYGIGKKVLQICMSDDAKTDYSAMIRGCSANYCRYSDFYDLSPKTLFQEREKTEWKHETLN